LDEDFEDDGRSGKERWITEDNSTRGKIHHWMLWSTEDEKEGKTGWQSPKNEGQVDLGF
jgi:hypothetical protein